jgi:hypothetical protein
MGNMKPANVLHITSLGPDWCDKDTVMLHACFQLLSDAIEVEKIFESDVDWDFDERHRAGKSELMALHQWWKRRSRMDEMGATSHQEDEDDAMLARLIRNRWALWI